MAARRPDAAQRFLLFEGRRHAPDRSIAATLVALWIVLWTVFVAGVVAPAAGLRRAHEPSAAGAAPPPPAAMARVAR